MWADASRFTTIVAVRLNDGIVIVISKFNPFIGIFRQLNTFHFEISGTKDDFSLFIHFDGSFYCFLSAFS